MSLRDKGYILLKGVIPKDILINFKRGFLENISTEKSINNCFTDGFNNRKFQDVLVFLEYEEILDYIRKIVGTLKWAYHTDINCNDSLHFHFHDDTSIRFCGKDIKYKNELLKFCGDSETGWFPGSGNIYKNFRFGDVVDYFVYRVGIYFQDSVNGGGLMVKPKSHLGNFNEDTFYIGSELGDVVIFDSRLMHSGTRYSGNNRLNLYYTIGQDNIWTDIHAHGAIQRQQKTLKSIGVEQEILSPDLSDKLDKLGIKK